MTTTQAVTLPALTAITVGPFNQVSPPPDQLFSKQHHQIPKTCSPLGNRVFMPDGRTINKRPPRDPKSIQPPKPVQEIIKFKGRPNSVTKISLHGSEKSAGGVRQISTTIQYSKMYLSGTNSTVQRQHEQHPIQNNFKKSNYFKQPVRRQRYADWKVFYKWQRFEHFLKFAERKQLKDRLEELDPPPVSRFIDGSIIDNIMNKRHPKQTKQPKPIEPQKHQQRIAKLKKLNGFLLRWNNPCNNRNIQI
jgi:hypothetical protein